ncbi:unnamed protein product [Absidia cylindrospora]
MHHIWRSSTPRADSSTSTNNNNSSSSTSTSTNRRPLSFSSNNNSNKISPYPVNNGQTIASPIQQSPPTLSLFVPQPHHQSQQQHYQHHQHYLPHQYQHQRSTTLYAPHQLQYSNSPLASPPVSPFDPELSLDRQSSSGSAMSTTPSVSDDNTQHSSWLPGLFYYKEPKVCTLDCVALRESEALQKTAHILEKHMDGKIEERRENGRVRRKGEFVLIQDSKSITIRFRLEVYQLPEMAMHIDNDGQGRYTFRLHFIQHQGDDMALMMGVQWIEQTLQSQSCYGQPPKYHNHQPPPPPPIHISNTSSTGVSWKPLK